MNNFEQYTYEINHESRVVKIYGWTHQRHSPWRTYIECFDNLKDALSKYPDACDTNPGNDCFL